MEVLKQYPIVPKPEIFGLHDNADITCDQNETYDLFATVLSLQPRVSAGVGASREDVIMAKCQAISAKLPAAFAVDAVQKKYPTMYEESMNTVLAQECIRCSYSPRPPSLHAQHVLDTFS
jgi:dynein heavy chain, axonemal